MIMIIAIEWKHTKIFFQAATREKLRYTKVYIKVNKVIEILQKEYPDPDKPKIHRT